MSIESSLALLRARPEDLPESLREPISGVSVADCLFVEAASLDGIAAAAVLAWLGVPEKAYLRARERWDDLLSEELSRDGARFDELYEDLLGRALSLWARPIDPLDRDVAAWLTYQRHLLAAPDPEEIAGAAGLTRGDEIRLARLWRERLASPALREDGLAALDGPLPPLPEVSVSLLVFPPSLAAATKDRS